MALPRAWALLPAAGLLLAAQAADAPFVVNVAPGAQPHVAAQVKRGTINVRLALSYDSALILNSEPAARAGLKAFPLLGKRTFKNAMLPGGAATFRFNLYDVTPAGLPRNGAPVVWVDKPVAEDADGVLSVTALKTERVVFNLGPQVAGSRTYTMSRPDRGSVQMKARVGDETIDVALELNSPDTVMNARAASALIGAGLVKRAGTVGYWRPLPGIVLPFERLVAAPGAKLLGLPLVQAGARVTEAQAKVIDARARSGTSTAEDDADTITVTASKKKGRDPWILIGRDVLGQCSRIEFDRPGKAWVLTCTF